MIVLGVNEPHRHAPYSEIRNIPQRSTLNSAAVKAAPVKKEETLRTNTSGTALPVASASKIDVNAIPIHKGTGKPITQVNIDEGQFPTSNPTK
jgi:pre-mRNA 3'-end-processing factor FIP1